MFHSQQAFAAAFLAVVVPGVVQAAPSPLMPARRLRMLVSVEHKDQLPSFADKFIEHRGALNVASGEH
jgi:hypothetical protein